LDSTEQKLADFEKRLAKLEDAVFSTPSSSKAKPRDAESAVVESIDSINTQDLIVISLKLHQKQSKEEIKATLSDWGKGFGSWFEGGNFGRLLKKGIVKKDGEEFALTKKGDLLADDLIAKARSGGSS
jgi:hypothetical protein